MMTTDGSPPPILGFAAEASLTPADFIRSDCNASAHSAVTDGSFWPDGRLIITGPAQCGKTHLTRIWAQHSGARILCCEHLEDSDCAAAAHGRAAAVLRADLAAGNTAQETGLFHLCNAAAQSGGKLLLTARRSAVFWPVRLADLSSRLRASRQTSIGPPDDRLLAALITKLFADRQISVAPNVAEYILPRMERTYEAAVALVAAMDRRGVIKGRRITRATAAEALAAMNSANDV